MLSNILKFFFGSKNDRFIRRMRPTITAINNLEKTLNQESDESIQQRFKELRTKATPNNLDELIVETFALVREASKRTIGLRHYDVQLIGGLALHYGNIAEMGTGEGKTLVATLPAVLNALTGGGVHIVTVNSYLAKRDAQWKEQIYSFLGLSVGVIVPGMDVKARRDAYEADITYACNNELGFDYLRDNMATNREQQVIRPTQEHPLQFSIVDEVDSILIDEARTPLIISGPTQASSEYYKTIYPITEHLQTDCKNPDITINIKERSVQLTESGHEKIEKQLKASKILSSDKNLYAPENAMLLHYVDACLRAKFILKRDIDYIVQDNQVVIIDENTGRAMPGRRWSNGHHQAVETKEGVAIQQENQTLASITYQNYFRQYKKLSGMTGTADTEATELEQIYKLQVLVIPPNKTCLRKNLDDVIFMSKKEKYDAIVADILERNKQQQPILIGTTSIENSEYLSTLLQKNKVAHRVLNAKNHEAEAEIIASAGEPGKVTIATNMAGRGTDIVLGGNLEHQLKKSKNPEETKRTWKKRHQDVLEAGGLHVLGSERNESRRVDNQLIGRCARQGDSGSSQFYLSLEDHLFKIFPQGVLNFIKQSSKKPGECLQAPMLNHAIASNQKKMEAHYFDIRKQILKYDDIANEQRLVLYEQRNELLNLTSIHDQIPALIEKACAQVMYESTEHGELNVQLLKEKAQNIFHTAPILSNEQTKETIGTQLQEYYLNVYCEKMKVLPEEEWHTFEKNLLLQILDHQWKEHLVIMEDLRESIGFRGYAQRNPEHEYKIESYNIFKDMLSRISFDFITHLMRLEIQVSNESTSKPIGELSEQTT